MLIASSRHRPGDVEAWEVASTHDLAWAALPAFRERVETAEMEVVRFCREPCYASVSWGKDSTVLADMVARVAPHVPLVHIAVEPIANPDCQLVRDVFMATHPCIYDEVTVHCRLDANGAHARGTLERGFAEARGRYGGRYVSGIRASESAGREWRRRSYSGDGACAPLIGWSAADVWAYLADRDLPVHPAYAMTLEGALDRDRLRVSSIGGRRGTGMGRRHWEEAYYPDVLALAEGR